MVTRKRVFVSVVVVLAVVSIYLWINRPQARFTLDLGSPRMIIEAGNSSNDLDVTSGGALIIKQNQAFTLTGETTSTDPWYLSNGGNNDEDKRRYPQIVFRAITPPISRQWANYQVSLSLTPTKHIVSKSLEVDGTDGVFLFMYYQDQDNLYVGGITKDGRMFIKQKVHGSYHLIVEEHIFEGKYHPNANLISPFERATILLRGRVENKEGKKVSITMHVQIRDVTGKLVFSHTLVGIDKKGFFSSGRAGFRLDSIEGIINEFSVEPIE